MSSIKKPTYEELINRIDTLLLEKKTAENYETIL